MEKCVQDEVVRNLKGIYDLRELPLPPSYIRYAKVNCNEDFVKLAPNQRFRRFITDLRPMPDKFLEFKRTYHRLLIDLYHNN